MLEFKKRTSAVKTAMDGICAMLNKHGCGVVYFGVKPKGDVTGQEVKGCTLDDIGRSIQAAIRPTIYADIKDYDVDGHLKYIKVEVRGDERPYSSYGRYFKRVFDWAEEMTPSELRRAMLDTDYSSIWENGETPYTIDDVDDAALKSFYDRAVANGRLAPLDVYDQKELLAVLDLLKDGKLTNAGSVLFSKKKPVVLKMAVFMTDERVQFDDLVRLEDNICNLIDQGISHIKRHMDWRRELSEDGATMNEIPEVPVDGIREIVVNSFAHANYRGDTEHEIDITPTEIEIYNPGEFVTNYTPLDFANRRIPFVLRNRKILDVLFKSKNVEIQGSGFRKTYRECAKKDVRIDYRFTDFGFSFAFKGRRPFKMIPFLFRRKTKVSKSKSFLSCKGILI